MPQLSESNALIQKIAEKMAREKVAPRAKAIDATWEFPWDVVDACRNTGSSTSCCPRSTEGWTRHHLPVRVIEELAKASGYDVAHLCSPITWALCLS